MINIVLPKEVQQLVEGSVFDNAGLIADDVLTKFLFYNPEIIRIYGLALADLKKSKSTIEQEVKEMTDSMDRKWASLVLKIDTGVYRNEDLRNARKYTSQDITVIQDKIREKERELIELDYEIETTIQDYYKYKNMQDTLSNLTKLRVSERKF